MSKLASLRSVVMQSSGLTLLAGAVLVGCASPGTPRPPSLYLPQTVSDLTAERVGDEVLLRWTTPAKTTDGLNVQTPLTAQICRQMAPVTGKDLGCSPVRRIPTTPGAAEALDVLPSGLTRGPAGIVGYRVELLNPRERSAGLSAAAFAAIGAVPPLVAGLRAEATTGGALLHWSPEDVAEAVELTRNHATSATQDKTAKKTTGSFSPAREEPARLRLLVARAEAGGTLDATARRGQTYVYTAQRVRRLVLNGHTLELRSAMSSPVTLAVRDDFPPRPPLGVEAIAASNAGVVGIDLSWLPNTDDDLAGYLVYRTETQSSLGAIARQITPALVVEPALRDTSVEPGHTYFYTVVAVDKAGNRSAPSEPAREDISLP